MAPSITHPAASRHVRPRANVRARVPASRDVRCRESPLSRRSRSARARLVAAARRTARAVTSDGPASLTPSRARCPRREEARMRTAARSAGYGALLVAAFAAGVDGGGDRPAGSGAPHTRCRDTPGGRDARPGDLGPAGRRAPGGRAGGRPVAGRRGGRLPGPARRGPGGRHPRAGVRHGQPRRRGGHRPGAPRRTPSAGSSGCARATCPGHVHPDATPPAPTDRAGPGIAFTAEVPGGGTYRLILDFRHAGAVHTAVFTLPAG